MKTHKFLLAGALMAATTLVQAGVIADAWTGWTQIAAEDQEGDFDYLDPGYGGQPFDAEYLYYKVEGTTLHLGLQTGFDVVDGHQKIGKKSYWAGDMQLTFGGEEFAIDFGLGTCGYSERRNHDCGETDDQGLKDAKGLYKDVTWNNDIVDDHSASAPFAMDSGTFVGDIDTVADFDAVTGSYYRKVSFNMGLLPAGMDGDFGLHWTMSCGNDAIDATAPLTTQSVPEPGSMALLAMGLLGLGALRRRA